VISKSPWTISHEASPDPRVPRDSLSTCLQTERESFRGAHFDDWQWLVFVSNFLILSYLDVSVRAFHELGNVTERKGQRYSENEVTRSEATVYEHHMLPINIYQYDDEMLISLSLTRINTTLPRNYSVFGIFCFLFWALNKVYGLDFLATPLQLFVNQVWEANQITIKIIHSCYCSNLAVKNLLFWHIHVQIFNEYDSLKILSFFKYVLKWRNYFMYRVYTKHELK